MKKIIFAVVILTTVQAYGQTKKIAHRSHSGSDASFDTESEDDFGLYPPHKKQARDTTAKQQPAAGKDSLPAKKPVPPKFAKTFIQPVRKSKIKT